MSPPRRNTMESNTTNPMLVSAHAEDPFLYKKEDSTTSLIQVAPSDGGSSINSSENEFKCKDQQQQQQQQVPKEKPKRRALSFMRKKSVRATPSQENNTMIPTNIILDNSTHSAPGVMSNRNNNNNTGTSFSQQKQISSSPDMTLLVESSMDSSTMPPPTLFQFQDDGSGSLSQSKSRRFNFLRRKKSSTSADALLDLSTHSAPGVLGGGGSGGGSGVASRTADLFSSLQHQPAAAAAAAPQAIPPPPPKAQYLSPSGKPLKSIMSAKNMEDSLARKYGKHRKGTRVLSAIDLPSLRYADPHTIPDAGGSYDDLILPTPTSYNNTAAAAAAAATPPPKRNVKFHRVEIREHNLSVGDNPCVSSGPPISLGWAYDPDHVIVDIDAFEAHRERHRRSRSELIMPREVRRYVLRHEFGVSAGELDRAARRATYAKVRRQITVTMADTELERAQEMARVASKRLKRFVGGVGIAGVVGGGGGGAGGLSAECKRKEDCVAWQRMVARQRNAILQSNQRDMEEQRRQQRLAPMVMGAGRFKHGVGGGSMVNLTSMDKARTVPKNVEVAAAPTNTKPNTTNGGFNEKTLSLPDMTAGIHQTEERLVPAEDETKDANDWDFAYDVEDDASTGSGVSWLGMMNDRS